LNISLVEKYRASNPEGEVVEIEADDSGWMMEQIIASGPSDNDSEKHDYLLKWEDFTKEENTCACYDNVEEWTFEILKAFYEKNPTMEKDARFEKKVTKKTEPKRKCKTLKRR
jgi:hypothetical protein